MVSASYQTFNVASIANLLRKLGPRVGVASFRRHPWLRHLLRVNQLHDRMTRTRTGPYREANAILIANIVATFGEMLEGVFLHPERTVMHEDLVPPEILFGMGLHPWMAEFLGIVLPMIDERVCEPYVDRAEIEGIPADICSLPKATMGIVLSDEMPVPAAVVSSNMPCDGGMAQYTVMKRKLAVPMFQLDVPYDFYDERAVAYFAGELRRMIAWFEQHTPGRMDWDRMREVCEERNRAVEAQLDLWDLLRMRPAPMAAEPVYLANMVYSVARPGTPRATKVFRKMAELARKNLEQGRGALPEEKHRVALWNPPTMMFLDLFVWAEQAYGVALLMDMLTFHRHPFVDTRSPDTMLRDLARIVMQGPMARHTRGPADNFFRDLFHMVEHFGLDMIWMAGHVGCKNTQALLGMFREKCRKRGIPLLIIDYDLLDTRIESQAGIQSQVDRFMETVMQEERRSP
jgi:benzoyl-CoA reductase/2-hydroxyglutaryl-CoA dehydratase subunit BcrC/BadD/HgdB